MDCHPIEDECHEYDCHDQAKAKVKLAADCFVKTHVSNLYGRSLLPRLVFLFHLLDPECAASLTKRHKFPYRE
jgi:hypothetical protein